MSIPYVFSDVGIVKEHLPLPIHCNRTDRFKILIHAHSMSNGEDFQFALSKCKGFRELYYLNERLKRDIFNDMERTL